MNTVTNQVLAGNTPARYLANAQELQDQATRAWQQAVGEKKRCAFVLGLLSVILAFFTASAIAPFIGASVVGWIAGYVAGLILHWFLGWSLHCMVFNKRAGSESSLGTVGAVVFAICILSFLGVAGLRAMLIADSGVPLWLAIIGALVVCALETAGPILAGFEYGLKAEKEHDAKLDHVFYQKFLGLIDQADDDASGAWTDKEHEIEDHLREARRKSTGSYKDEKVVTQWTTRLQTLKVHHPKTRYRRSLPTIAIEDSVHTVDSEADDFGEPLESSGFRRNGRDHRTSSLVGEAL